MLRATPATAVVALAVSCVLVTPALTGCGKSDDLADGPPAAPVVNGAGPSQTAGDGGGSASGSASPKPASTVATPARSTRIEAPNGVAGTIEIGFVGLEVDGKLATLTLTFTPRYDEDPGQAISLFDMFGRNVAEVTLVDTVNLRRYLVVEDSRGLELGPFPATVETRNNVPVTTMYTFAAPPAEVTTVDVYADDRVIFDDAAVTR